MSIHAIKQGLNNTTNGHISGNIATNQNANEPELKAPQNSPKVASQTIDRTPVRIDGRYWIMVKKDEAPMSVMFEYRHLYYVSVTVARKLGLAPR